MIKIKGRFKRKKQAKRAKVKAKKVKRKGKRPAVLYPRKVVAPVASFLQSKLKRLEKRKKEVEEEDPFTNESRTMDNASPDTDAAEQFGHARTTAVKEQLDKKMIQTKKALARVKVGKYGVCEECGRMIDTDRLVVYPEATLCAADAAKKENK